MDNLFSKIRLLIEWKHRLVGNHVVEEGRRCRSCKAEIAYLDGRGPTRQDAGPAEARKAVEIDDNLHVEIAQQSGDLLIAPVPDIDEAVKRLDHTRAQSAAVVWSVRNAKNLKSRTV